MTAQALITLRGLAVGYDRQTVLDGIDLDIAQGDFVGLLGANGSGKTTLLKTIAGILPPLRGKIATASPSLVAGYVPQRETIDAPFLLSSLEIARMGLCGRIGPGKRLPRAERELVLECLRQAGAEDLATKPFALLSGGQKQRVLIARALAARPDVLLLDEPTAGIDPAATEAIALLLQSLNQGGMTILMVNHDLPVVRRIATTVFWIRGGRIDRGATAEILNDQVLERLSLQME